MGMKQLSKVICFLLVGILLFLAVQDVFTPEWNGNVGCGRAISGFRAMEENSVDAVFLGTSLVACGVSPMRIYEETGIRTYNLGTSTQSIQASFYLLEEAFRTQNPSVVFLEPSNFFYSGVNRSFYRIVMDNLYYSKAGFDMALEYNRIFGEGLASSLLPMTNYHGRWKELNPRELGFSIPEPYSTMGYYMVSHTAPVDETVIDIYKEHLSSVQSGEMAGPGADITEEVHSFILRIARLCRENGAELVIMKLPSFRSVAYEGWSDDQNEAVKQIASELDVPYLNLMEQDLVDYTTDTRDGIHLHIRGAEKASSYLGEYLRSQYPQLEAGEHPAYEAALKDYRDLRSVAMLQSETDLAAYLDMLIGQSENWSVTVAASGDFLTGLEETDRELLVKLGLDAITDVGQHENYVAVIQNGKVRTQKTSARFVKASAKLESGANITVTAANAYDVAVEEKATSVTMNDTEMLTGNAGIHFFVWDNETELPLDAKSFATADAEKLAGSDLNMVKTFLREYETEICFAKN